MTTTAAPPDTAPIDNVMEDFIFGGIERDEQHLLATQRQRRTGLRHLYDLTPRDPLPGQPVTMTVYVGPDVQVDRVSAYVTTDGTHPTGQRGVAVGGFTVNLAPVMLQWEALLWDYVQIWQGEVPAQPANTFVQYVIEGWRSYDTTYACWSNELHLDGTVERATRYGYTVDHFATPQWAREAVLYQIFIDRFSGVANRWLTSAEMNAFVGGTLQGVIEQLDYIADLGVTVIWLTPIFVTPTYHGYDTTDYYAIDPHFGTKAELRRLVAGAHARGLRVILDFVANHTSINFTPFIQAQADPNSPHRSWFNFADTHQHGYRTFFNVASMPQLDTDQPAVRAFLIDAARYWLTEFGIDGYRLDYAAGPSHAFWSEFRAACKSTNPDCWLFGEVTLAGDDLRSYQGRLDGCLDFAFCRLLRQLCARPQPSISLAYLVNAIQRSHDFFKQDGTGRTDFLLPSFLDNHDMNRFLWTVGNDKARLLLAAGLLFAFGDAPVIYYGTEVGLSQPRSKGPWREEARHPMLWGDSQDQMLLAAFKTLIALRRRHPALIDGSITTHLLDERAQVWLAERTRIDDRVLIAVNLGAEPYTLSLPWPQAFDQHSAAVTQPVAIPATAVRFFTDRPTHAQQPAPP